MKTDRCVSKAARHSHPRILISCDTESLFLVTSSDGISRGVCCRASKKLQVFFFPEEGADFCINNGTLPLVRCRHNSSQGCRSEELTAPVALSLASRLHRRCPRWDGLGKSGLPSADLQGTCQNCIPVVACVLHGASLKLKIRIICP